MEGERRCDWESDCKDGAALIRRLTAVYEAVVGTMSLGDQRVALGELIVKPARVVPGVEVYPEAASSGLAGHDAAVDITVSWH